MNGDTRSFKVLNDSMAPKYRAGETVYVDRISVAAIEPGYAYLIEADDGQNNRYAFAHVESIDAGVLHMRYLNTDRFPETYTLPIANVTYAGVALLLVDPRKRGPRR